MTEIDPQSANRPRRERPTPPTARRPEPRRAPAAPPGDRPGTAAAGGLGEGAAFDGGVDGPPPGDDGEYVEIRRFRPGGSRVLTAVVVVLLVLGMIAGGSLVWTMRQIDPPGDQGGRIARIDIAKGESLSELADVLERRGVIASATVFRYYARWRGATSWKAGEYVNFHTNSAMSDVLDVLARGPLPPATNVVTVIPGTRLAEAFEAINKVFPAMTPAVLTQTLASGQVAMRYHPAGASWEGLLAPDTYQFAQDATPRTVLQTLATQMEKELTALGYDRADALTGHSAYDLVTIASLIERETGQPADERGKIARVIFNRLETHQILGIDAAVLYGLGRRGGALTASDLAKDTPYNTRKHQGLPPTPISLPAKASLQAAISPPAGNWIYYVLVSNNPPTHLFTASEKEFERAKAKAKADGVF